MQPFRRFFSYLPELNLLELTPYTQTVLVVGLRRASPSATLDKIYLIEFSLVSLNGFVKHKYK
ncbi:MAG: hypothetical protein K0Q56_53 [Sporolactobacillus laevolacticus]|jgi:hypothetical protein|nr:hypothetical protein [Sporolactobacillus laevolacticus]